MKYIHILFTIIVVVSCNNNPQVEAEADHALPPEVARIDTLVGKQDVTKIIPGSEYLKKAYSYTVIAGRDTSTFKCHFSEWKTDNTLFFVTKFSKSLSYREHMKQLGLIIAEAQADFELGTLKTIGLGRLVETGDLAIKVSRQYEKIYGNKSRKPIDKLDTFLLHSALVDDFNTLLEPYRLKVMEVITEKKFFIPGKKMADYGVIETNPSQIPENVIDCITYLKVGKI